MFRGIGRVIRIRTLNDGVRVRSVTVTLYLYVQLLSSLSRTSDIIHTAKANVKHFKKLFAKLLKIFALRRFSFGIRTDESARRPKQLTYAI